MPYPTVPDLKPFEGQQRPNLLAGGPYDEQLTAIEDYLKSLGSYIDDTVLAAAQAAQSTAQAAQATANANAATIGDWATDHPDSTISQAVTSTNESVSELSGKLDTTTQTANTAASNASAALTWTQNASAVSANVPTKINSTGNGTDTVAALLFGSDGTEGALLDKLALLLSNLMLAAPNGDTTKLFGYLADNSADLTTATARPRSSSALTWASEQGGYEGNVYNVPVSIDASGLVRLDVEGEFVIHAGETLFVVQSEYESFAEGSLLGYSGSGATLDNDGVNIVGDLLTLFEPASGYESNVYGVPVTLEDVNTEEQTIAVSLYAPTGEGVERTINTNETLQIIANGDGDYPNGTILIYTAANAKTINNEAATSLSTNTNSADVEIITPSGPSMPAQNPETDPLLTAGELANASAGAGQNTGIHKTASGNWLYVGTAAQLSG